MIIFISHPIQYVSPLFREFSSSIDLLVCYYGGESSVNDDKGFGQKVIWDIPLLEGYDYMFLKNFSKSTGMNNSFFDAINWDVFKVLRKSKDEIVMINGWAYLSDWFVLIGAKFYGKKVWMRSEMPWNQEVMKRKNFKKKLKYYIFKRIIFRFFIDKFLYIGKQNKKYYQMHGVQDTRLIYTPYAVDNKRFQMQLTDSFDSRKKWGISAEDVVVLYSGKLIEKKRPLDLLRAFHDLNNPKVYLFFLGDGPLRGLLESFVELNGTNNVIISGFINQSEVANVYAMADIFVMCSGIGETWGLSVNEAMNFSLPVIVSSTCGCSYDLINQAENGFVFQEGDVSMLRNLINDLVQNSEMRNRMGQSSKDIIKKYSHKVTCDNVIEVLLD
jgi:glycosyltransferase involved in cell wall biosynthesis